MSCFPGSLDVYAGYRVSDLLREAENDRLADQIVRRHPTIRIRLAERLRAAAQWIDGTPQLAGT